jgi:IS30 family transposase
MSYHHLTQLERYQIYAFLKADFSIRHIATELVRSPSTISRELRRNRNLRGYRPKMAQRLADQRAVSSRLRFRIAEHQWRGIASLLKQQWSPDQIAHRARHEGTLNISHQWIYRYIVGDRTNGGLLWRQLRRASLRRRHYHRGRKPRQHIRFRVGIEQRPSEVESRNELGHWEGDTILGSGRRGAVLTVVERKSRYLRMGVLPNLRAKTIVEIISNRLHQLSARVQSITLDNGSEFSYHPRIARALSTDIYFAEPYKPWQRGSNENTNGLIEVVY